MGMLTPENGGVFEIEGIPDDFVDRMAHRVEQGLFVPGNRLRANYSVRTKSRDTIHFGSDSVWTSINVGLNEVTLSRTSPGRIDFHFTYWAWLLYGVGLCGIISVLLLGGYLLLGTVREAVNSQPWNIAIFWSMIVFWGLLWPWILVILHKRPAARLLERIVREVCRDEHSGAAVSPVLGGRAMQSGKVYRSKATVLGTPLVMVAWGPDENGKLVTAKGIIAIGNMAVGAIAIGNIALGLISCGGIAAGGIAVGGLAVGGVALAGLAIGAVAAGGLAVGLFALGGLSVGIWGIANLMTGAL